jgi:amidase
MSRNINSLVAVTKAVIDAAPWDQDPKCCPMPWRSEVFEEARSRPLVIAVMQDDGVVKPHPPVSRVLENVVLQLQLAGHEIVSWTPGSLHQECIDIMVGKHVQTQWPATKCSTGPVLHRRRRRRHS